MSRRLRQYDPDNGQIFYEQQLSATAFKHRLASKSQAWSRVPSSVIRKRRNRCGLKGPKSLKAMALEVCIDNIGSIEHDTLLGVPVHLLWDIWESTNSSLGNIPFQAWKTFINFLSNNDRHHETRTATRRLWRYHLSIEDPGAPFVHYIKPLTSNKFDFIVHLIIADGTACNSSELLILPTMSNLGVLDVIQPRDVEAATSFPRVTDSILREWSQATKGATPPFPSLRILKIWGEDFTTHRSLEYVTRLPSLAIYDVAGRKQDWPVDHMQHPAWTHKVEHYASGDRASIYCLSNTLAEIRGTKRTEDDLLLAEAYMSLPKGTEFEFISAAGIPKTIGPVHEDYKSKLCKYVYDQKGSDTYLKETPEYVVYSQLGKLWADRDLRVQGKRVPQMVTYMGELVLPSLPYASIVLGYASDHDTPFTSATRQTYMGMAWELSSSVGVDLAHNVFIRPNPWQQKAAPSPTKRKAEEPSHSRTSRQRKRQGVGSLLSELTGRDSSKN